MTQEDKKIRIKEEKARYYQKYRESIILKNRQRYHKNKKLKGKDGLGSKTKLLWQDPEYRKRMSEAHKGKSGYWLGKEIPKEARDKMRDAKLENPTKYWLNKNCPHFMGEKNPGYIHGNSPEHKKQRKSIEYKIWRRAVFDRDDYTCQKCGARGCAIEADHIKPFAFYPSLRFDVANGRTLCKPCHRKTPTFGKGSYAFKPTELAA